MRVGMQTRAEMSSKSTGRCYAQYTAQALRLPPDERRMPVQGTMLWFNEVKDFGVIETDEDGRFEVCGEDFEPGHKPVGRCKGTPVTFTASGEIEQRRALEVSVIPERDTRRARSHRRGAG